MVLEPTVDDVDMHAVLKAQLLDDPPQILAEQRLDERGRIEVSQAWEGECDLAGGKAMLRPWIESSTRTPHG